MICLACTNEYMQGTACPACGDSRGFRMPVEILESYVVEAKNKTAVEKILKGFVVVIEKNANFLVLQQGTNQITIWNPLVIVTKLYTGVKG